MGDKRGGQGQTNAPVQTGVGAANDTFVSLYLELAGVSEIPQVYHYWCALSLVAACVADRVWVAHRPGVPIRPNLYVLLLGESAIGKGQAIDHVCKLVATQPWLVDDVYYGRTSGPFLTDWMAGYTPNAQQIKIAPGTAVSISTPPRKHEAPYLINEELALNIGSGARADDFVKHMTGLSQGTPLPYHDGTRSNGHVVLNNACVNWLAGTTPAWLTKSISFDAIEGGFFGRIVCVEAHRPPRKFDVKAPANALDLQGVLERCMELLHDLQGEVAVAPFARDTLRRWYMGRDEPHDPALRPSWNRDLVLTYKVGTVLALAEWVIAYAIWQDDGEQGMAPEPVIEQRHVEEAHRVIQHVHAPIPKLLRDATASKTSKLAQFVMDRVAKFELHHSELLRMVGARGYTSADLAVCVNDLIESKQLTVRQEKPARGRAYNVYSLPRRRVVRSAVPEVPHEDEDGNRGWETGDDVHDGPRVAPGATVGDAARWNDEDA